VRTGGPASPYFLLRVDALIAATLAERRYNENVIANTRQPPSDFPAPATSESTCHETPDSTANIMKSAIIRMFFLAMASISHATVAIKNQWLLGEDGTLVAKVGTADLTRTGTTTDGVGVVAGSTVSQSFTNPLNGSDGNPAASNFMTAANAIQNGISGCYDSLSGKKLGVEYLGMTCTVVTMMLDGLCQKHQLKIKTN